MSKEPPIPIMPVAVVCGVLVWFPLVVILCPEPPVMGTVLPIIFGALVWEFVFFGGLILRDTIRRRGMWGINFKQAVCTRCGTPMPMVRKPANWRQAVYGGWTCHECGFELNKWGRPTKEQNILAKWAVFRAAGDADEGKPKPQTRDVRIRNVNDQTQRGDAL